jgi:hypothetical protein
MVQYDDLRLHGGTATKAVEKGIERYQYKVEHGPPKGSNPGCQVQQGPMRFSARTV